MVKVITTENMMVFLINAFSNPFFKKYLSKKVANKPANPEITAHNIGII